MKSADLLNRTWRKIMKQLLYYQATAKIIKYSKLGTPYYERRSKNLVNLMSNEQYILLFSISNQALPKDSSIIKKLWHSFSRIRYVILHCWIIKKESTQLLVHNNISKFAHYWALTTFKIILQVNYVHMVMGWIPL